MRALLSLLSLSIYPSVLVSRFATSFSFSLYPSRVIYLYTRVAAICFAFVLLFLSLSFTGGGSPTCGAQHKRRRRSLNAPARVRPLLRVLKSPIALAVLSFCHNSTELALEDLCCTVLYRSLLPVTYSRNVDECMSPGCIHNALFTYFASSDRTKVLWHIRRRGESPLSLSLPLPLFLSLSL